MLQGANFTNAIFNGADVSQVLFDKVKSVNGAQIKGIKGSGGKKKWLKQHGAID